MFWCGVLMVNVWWKRGELMVLKRVPKNTPVFLNLFSFSFSFLFSDFFQA